MISFHYCMATVICLGAVALLAAVAPAQSTPVIPVLRIGKLAKPPVIDGKIDPDEWQGAARITGFQDFGRRALTIPALQPHWYVAYDQDYLYLAQSFPVYPKGTLKARVKVGDNGGQNSTGDEILGDDHVEIQICDLPTRPQAIKQYFYKIMTNPYGAVVDQRTEWSVGWTGLEWESQAKVKVQNSDDGWTMEMAIPLKNLGHPAAPPDGAHWFVQLVSASDGGFFYNAWQPVLWTAWDLMPEIIFDSTAPVFQLQQLGELGQGKLDTRATVRVAADQPPVQMNVTIVDADGKELFNQTQTAAANRPEPAQLHFVKDQLPLDQRNHTIKLLATQGDKIIYRASLPFETENAQQLQRMYQTMEQNRAGAGQAVIASCYYHSYRTLAAHCDVNILKIDPKIRAAKTFRCSLESMPGEKVIASADAAIEPNGVGKIQLSVPPLSAGEYRVVSRIVGPDGQSLASRVDPFTQQTFEWENNKLGTEAIVPEPFTAVKVADKTLQVWGRSIGFADSGFPLSIVSLDQELLDAPITLLGQADGKAVALEPQGTGAWTEQRDDHATFQGRGRLGNWADTTVQASTEYDGTTIYTLTLTPRAADSAATMDQLDLLLPLREMTDWQAVRSSGRDTPYGVVPAADGAFWDSSKMPAAAFIHGTFLPYCVLSDGQRALSWAADSDQGWMLDDTKPSFFLERHGKQTLMRVRLVNTPSRLTHQRTIRFMLTTMPTKPLPPDYRYRTWGTRNAPFGWMNGFQGSCMWAYGTGPTNVLHTQEQYDILKQRLEQDRRRVRFDGESVCGPKFLPMSAWYVATNVMGYAMPEYDTYCGEWLGLTSPRPSPQEDYINFKNEWGVWSEPRQQSRAYADLVQSTVDCRVWAFDQQQKKAGMNGYWWDHGRFWTSGDPIKQTAYQRDDGSWQGIYNISLMRQMMKRMAVCAQLNGVAPFHGYYSHGQIGPITPFLQWSWAIEGPWYVNSSEVSLLDNIRGGLDGIRILLQTYNGLPITMRNETMDRNSKQCAQTRSCLGVGLLFDVGVGFEGGCVNEQAREKLIDDLRRFDYFNSQVAYTPYWKISPGIKISDPHVVASVYRRELPGQTPGMMLVLFNAGDTATTVTLSADAQALLHTTSVSLHDLENWSREPLPQTAAGWEKIAIGRHDFRLLLLGPRASGGD